MEEIFKLTEASVSKDFLSESSGHDINHLKRVFNIALHLQSVEGGDRLVVGVSALLHDVHRLIKPIGNKVFTPEESLPKIRQILDNLNLTEEQKQKILNSVQFHENYNFANKEKISLDIETQIIQDADRIDAIGAIGVARCFTYCGHHNLPMWIPELAPDEKGYDSSKNDPSGIHHFYSKLLKLGGDMNTETGREIAKSRHEFTKHFLDRFLREWDGLD